MATRLENIKKKVANYSARDMASEVMFAYESDKCEFCVHNGRCSYDCCDAVCIDGIADYLNEEDLKPCPFCGGTDLLVALDLNYYVKCKKCLATGPATKAKESAIEGWNNHW